MIQGCELKENKIHVGHPGKYPPFSRYALTNYSCVTYQNERYFHAFQHCCSMTLSKNVIQGCELKENKTHVGHLGNYPQFSRSDLYSSHIVVWYTEQKVFPRSKTLLKHYLIVKCDPRVWIEGKQNTHRPSWKISAIFKICTHHTELCNIPNKRYSHALQHCCSIALSKNVIQEFELKENKIHVGHLGKYPPFSRYVLITHRCVVYQTKGISVLYNIAVASPYRKMWSKGLNWRKTKYTPAILEKWPPFSRYQSHALAPFQKPL